MKSIIWHGRHDFELEERPEPVPGPDQVVVQIQVTTICASDFHLEEFGTPPPLIPGHEAAGIVVELGSNVTSVRTGARVTMNPVQYCGSCHSCKRGIEHLCLNIRHLGGGGIPGTWAERVAVDARNVLTIPEEVSFTAAALTEPTAVCYQSFQRAGLRKGDVVLVLGDGPFGFLHAQIASSLGAGKVICAGHYDQRLIRIRNTTGVSICNTQRDDLLTLVRDELSLEGVDIAIEATGNGSAPSLGLRALRSQGTLVVFSYIWNPEILDMGLIHTKELNIIGSCRSHRTFDLCLKLMADGLIDTESLVDLTVPLQRYKEALAKLKDDKANTFKVAFTPLS